MEDIKINEITLAYMKEYLKVDYDDEDATISALILAAKSYVETMLGFKIEKEWPNREDIPSELTIACLLLISHWFDRRQVQVIGTLADEMKFAVSAIVEAHKRPFKEYEEAQDEKADE